MRYKVSIRVLVAGMVLLMLMVVAGTLHGMTASPRPTGTLRADTGWPVNFPGHPSA
jgi:hypothetical protein